MRYILICLMLFSCVRPAMAYDDQESQKVFANCLAKKVAPNDDAESLLMACRPELWDFERYNCPNDPMTCEGLGIQAAAIIVRKEINKFNAFTPAQKEAYNLRKMKEFCRDVVHNPYPCIIVKK